MTTHPDNRDILFIFGPARGGTTFLSDTMSNWFDYGTGPEGTFVKKFLRSQNRYGDLKDRRNLERLAKDLSRVEMLDIVRRFFPVKWKCDVKPDDILAQVHEPTMADAIYGVFAAVAACWGQSRIGNKNPSYWKILDEIEAGFGRRAKYLFLLRDGRDVFLSQNKQPWGKQSAFVSARDWADMVNRSADHETRVGAKRFLTVKYEELLSNPKHVFCTIGRFVGADDIEARASRYAQCAEKNDKKNNFDKWKTEMKARDLWVFEAIAREELQRSGYEIIYRKATIGSTERMGFEIGEIFRLTRINTYYMRKQMSRRFFSRARD